jgi:uncharacterized membrane protein
MFLALSLLLATTGWGMIAIPTPAGAVTAMHLPIIIAGILGGPLMGGCAGCAFGLFAWMRFPAFDPLVHILPRVFIGISSWIVFHMVIKVLRYSPRTITIASCAAAAAGTLTNTAGVLSMAVFFNYFTPRAAWTLGIIHGLPELILALVIVPAVVAALAKTTPLTSSSRDCPPVGCHPAH